MALKNGPSYFKSLLVWTPQDFENRFSHPAPKSFAKVDLLPIHNDSEKKKVSKNINNFKFFENYW